MKITIPNPQVVSRVRNLTGATKKEVVRGWRMDEWCPDAMLIMLECSASTFRRVNGSRSVTEVVEIRNEFRKQFGGRTPVKEYRILDLFMLRKLFALIEAGI